MEQFLQMSDGHVVYTRQFKPAVDCIGHFHILHGMAEHSKRYEKFAFELCAAGYYVTMHDHRGHGQTAKRNGQLGYFADEAGFDRVVQDAKEVIMALHTNYPDVPLTLFGHSMGSFIARRYIQLHSNQVDQVILCGTGAVSNLHRIGHYVAKALAKKDGKKTESPLLNEMSFGSFNKHFPDAKTAFDWLCSVEDEVHKYMQDPDCGFIPSNQFFVDLTEGLIAINKKSAIANVRKNLPVLLISGSKDPVGELGQGVYSVAQQYHKAGIQDVTVYLFENKRHEILNEDNQQAVFQVLLRWLDKYDT